MRHPPAAATNGPPRSASAARSRVAQDPAPEPLANSQATLARLDPVGPAQRLGQVLRYGGTAGAAAVVDIVGFWLLFAAGLPMIPAAALSFLVATVVNYGLTARFVFAAPVSMRGYAKFLAAAFVGFCLNVGITAALALGIGLSPVAAKICGVGVAFFANFAMNAAVVFRPGGR